jgi:hypothetical protein
VLAIFSDMRRYTEVLDLERPSTLRPAKAIEGVEKQRLIPNLKGVEVYVLGADAAGKSIGYWQHLRDFWTAYFQKAGASLLCYSVLRELPSLQ